MENPLRSSGYSTKPGVSATNVEDPAARCGFCTKRAPHPTSSRKLRLSVHRSNAKMRPSEGATCCAAPVTGGRTRHVERWARRFCALCRINWGAVCSSSSSSVSSAALTWRAAGRHVLEARTVAVGRCDRVHQFSIYDIVIRYLSSNRKEDAMRAPTSDPTAGTRARMISAHPEVPQRISDPTDPRYGQPGDALPRILAECPACGYTFAADERRPTTDNTMRVFCDGCGAFMTISLSDEQTRALRPPSSTAETS